LFWWSWQCFGAIGCASPGTEGLGLPQTPLDTAIGQVFPRITLVDAVVIDFGDKHPVVALWNRFPKLAFKRHETDPLFSSSKQQAS
jgi:hypothetical protein